ncbi:MAG: hypothetical protein H6835_06365 [Planctomycetes bacterium]|nr:hypothetical protein [Planctomycetota bacterium]
MPIFHCLPRRCAVGVLLAALPACHIATPLALPPVAPSASWSADTTSAELMPRGLVVALFALAQPPEGTPITLAAAVIGSDRGAPFRGRSRLPIGTLWLDDAAARTQLTALQTATPAQAQQLGDATAFVVNGLCTTLAAPDTPLPQLQLRPHTDGIEVQLVTPLADDAASAADPDAAGHEHLTIAGRLGETDTAGLFVPAPAIAGGGYLLTLLPGPPPAAEEVEARRTAARPTAPAEAAAPASAAWQVAMRAIGEQNRRPALLALLTPPDLQRAADVVLAADERGLIAITRALAALPPEQREQPWPLERAVWTGLRPRIERDDLTPALRASLVRQLGALDDDPSTLSLLLDTSVDCGAFAAALREENVVALDDRSAALRVVADDWLRRNAAAVPGYAPLADKAVRREALHAWRAAQAAAEEATAAKAAADRATAREAAR